ncbi:hypothetical protein C8R41DRAFT_869593 [Lentinula lateritia]|uniref:Uncharacterized protein n=1 Tax=Lentinula lateritia TaxID=40482 RepID=A0ABQ8VA59_9AGAR|nr:hypothetical protein C8R41DRAFT_869593 [Lentinula lateritia]
MSGGGFEDPGPAACPRKSVRTKKRRRTDTYDYEDNTTSRFATGNMAAKPSKDVLVDLTTQLARISFGTQTTVGHIDYSSWVTNLKAIMEGTSDNVKDLAVSSLVNIAHRCDLASKVDGTAWFVRVKPMPRASIPPLGTPKIHLYCNLLLIVLSRYTYPFILVLPYCLLLYPAGLHV